jgi:hypothetical protein
MKKIRYFSPSTLSGGSCDRKVTLIQEGYRERLEKNYITIGSAVHKYLALRANGFDDIEAAAMAGKVYSDTNPEPVIPWIDATLLYKICHAIEDKPSKETIVVSPQGKPCVEFSLAMPLHETEDTMFVGTGTVDAFILWGPDAIAIQDYKVTTKWEVDLREYELSSQFLHYAWLIRAKALSDPTSWVAQYLFPKLNYVVIESIKIQRGVAGQHTQHAFKIDWQRVDEYGDMLLNYVKNIFIPNKPTGLFTGTCMSGKDYACVFQQFCRTGKLNNYVQTPYNPIKRHEGSRQSPESNYSPV